MRTEKKFQWFWESLDRYLAENQLKQTKQRRLIVDCFLHMNDHVDAEALMDFVKKEGHNFGLATIYRTLNLLKEAGLADARTFADGRTVFEVYVPNSHHDHLVCLECGRVTEFENDSIEELQRQVAKEFGYTLESHRLDLYGKCANCR